MGENSAGSSAVAPSANAHAKTATKVFLMIRTPPEAMIDVPYDSKSALKFW
jgi:hypothetical protein